MKIEVETIEEFFTAVPEKEKDLREVDALIMATLSNVRRALKKLPSITLLVYWPGNLSIDDWPPIGLAPQKNYISLYVSGEKEGQAPGDYYADRPGKTSNGKAYIRFRKTADISKAQLRQLILDAAAG